MDSVSPSKKALHNSPIGTFQKSNLIQTIETEDKLNLEKDNNNINDQEIKASSPSSLVPPSLKSSLNETEHKPLLHSLENSTDDLSNSSDDLVSHSSSRAVEFNLPEPLISRGWDVATEVTFVKPPMNTIDFEPLIPLSLKTRSTSSIMMNAESLYNTIRVPEPFQEEIQKEAISNNGFWGPDVPGTNAEFNEDKSFFIKDEFPAPNNHISHDYWEPPPAPTVNAEKASLYLNTVKARFSKSPAYYYSFLDIMKDYGSKSISTLEVVARVTELFESHPDLIEEFHSFLPPNLQNMYKNYAEIPESPCLSPSLPEEQAEKANETFSPHENCVEKPFSSGYVSLYTTPSPASPSKLPESPSNSAHGPASNGAEDMTTAAVARVEPVDPVKQALYNNPHDDVRKFAAFEASVHEAAHLHGIFLSGAATPRKPEVFHAFNYVTKIRERFSNQTETYKKFLDVLTTFKREKKTIEEVYRQVSLLFRDHPDLLEEFSQFLPERAGELSIYSAHPSPPPLPPHHHHYYHHHHHHHFHPRGFHPPQPRAHPLFVNRPYPSHHHTPSSNTTPSEVSRGAPYHSLPSISPPGHADQTDSPHARLPLRAPSFDQPDASPSSESRLWQMHEARNPLQREETGKRRYSSDFHFQLKRGRTAEDHVDLDNYQYVLFFDDLKKCCPHKEAYYNFLRLLNLYNSHLIGREDLLEIAAKFITTKNEKGEIDRTTKLYVTFKEMLGFSCKEEENDFQAPSSDAFLVDVKNFDFSTCKRYGFSYRHKPIEQCNQKCSGKTKLSDEVLNDRLVSFSILTSEEKVDSKKNVYEEALYRVEDERYELDMVLASNLDAIRHLEYQFKRLQEFSEEERYLQKLDSKLGGTSEVLCHAAIERIYGEKAREVVDGIMRHPTSVLPIVLKRLKQKDDDWRKAKSDWDKIWRELTEKNFARSLDYQSPSFKANDKKAIAVKTLLAEIETINSESDKKPHYELVFEDEDVLKDCIELLLFYINKNGSDAEKKKASFFLRKKFPHLIGCSHLRIETEAEPEDPIIKKEPINDRNEKNGSVIGASSDLGTELQKDPLDHSLELKNKASLFNDETDLIGVRKVKDTTADLIFKPLNSLTTLNYNNSDDDNNRNCCNNSDNDSNNNNESEFTLYCNTPWYAFFRLFQKLYERMKKLKSYSSTCIPRASFSKKSKEVAVKLNYKPSVTPKEEHYYINFLSYAHNFLDTTMDAAAFEDAVRELYGIHAYIIFTIDKVVHACWKQLLLIIIDETSKKLQLLYDYEQLRESDLSLYRQKALLLLEEENCFELTFRSKAIAISLIENPIEFFDPSFVSERWSQYIEGYTHETSLNPSLTRYVTSPVFLKRTLVNKGWPEINRNGLEYKICLNSYKMYYVYNTEDFMFRTTPQKLFSKKKITFEETTTTSSPSKQKHKIKITAKNSRSNFKDIKKSPEKLKKRGFSCVFKDWLLKNLNEKGLRDFENWWNPS